MVETQREFVSKMDLGEGIALNEALRENLFMLLVNIRGGTPQQILPVIPGVDPGFDHPGSIIAYYSVL